MPEWENICMAASSLTPSCSPYSFSSALSFLPRYGIDTVEEASEEQIQIAWHTLLNSDALGRSDGFAQYQQYFTPKNEIVGTGNVTYIRSFINFGTPQDVNDNDKSDHALEQQHRIYAF